MPSVDVPELTACGWLLAKQACSVERIRAPTPVPTMRSEGASVHHRDIYSAGQGPFREGKTLTRDARVVRDIGVRQTRSGVGGREGLRTRGNGVRAEWGEG